MGIKNKTKKTIKYIMPYGATVVYGRIKDNVKSKKNKNDLNYCPLCKQESIFHPMISAGVRPRPRAICPNCSSLERHRLTWLFIERRIGIDNVTNKKSLLHIAPEVSLKNILKERVGKKYITADMYEDGVDIKMDITDIKYPNESFDAIICNHVLEHVDDDIKAMSELYRVQKKGGWSILLVPIADMATTYEDKRITSKKGRLEAFGQDDHVRKYGKDYEKRLRGVGYRLDIIKSKDIATSREIKKMSLKEDSKLWGFTSTEIYFCTK